MPKIKTSRTRTPAGFSLLEPTLTSFHNKMREFENEDSTHKRKDESLWGIFRLHHQRSRYIYDQYYVSGTIDRDVYDYCVDQGYADQQLIGKWRKQGYERLCCLRCIQTKDTNHGNTCICRVPTKSLDEGTVIQCSLCGCRGCSSAGGTTVKYEKQRKGGGRGGGAGGVGAGTGAGGGSTEGGEEEQEWETDAAEYGEQDGEEEQQQAVEGEEEQKQSHPSSSSSSSSSASSSSSSSRYHPYDRPSSHSHSHSDSHPHPHSPSPGLSLSHSVPDSSIVRSSRISQSSSSDPSASAPESLPSMNSSSEDQEDSPPFQPKSNDPT